MTLPSYAIKIPEYVAETIRNMHPDLKRKVKAALQAILAEPHSGKALKNELTGLRSFRVNRFRIVYQINDARNIELVAVGPRRCIYEETCRILKLAE